ncbi:MAG: PilC/PilY family type IV pilus protein, partial [Gammaproteobacteria bacterium]
LHNNNSIQTPVHDIDDVSLPVDTTAQANKTALLENLFNVNSSGGTPLRRGLQNAGKYYEGLLSSGWGASPILPETEGGACQQNFTVLMSDGFWNGWAPNPSIGNVDSGTGPFDGGSHADNYADTLADVAMHYYERDLSTLDDQVPLTGVDPRTASGKMHQHMVTFTVAFGINGQLTLNPPNRTEAFDATNGGPWPQPVADQLSTIDDMRHAAWNGRGEFLSAADPQGLLDSLDSALAAISGRTSSAAAVAFNSGSLSTDSEVFLALFNSGRWSGDLKSYALDPLTGDVSSSPSWSAADALDSRILASSPRTLLSYDGTDGIPLQWSSLTVAQKSDLRTNASGTLDTEAAGMARLGFIRGERGCEASSTSSCYFTDGTTTFTTKSFRDRASRLGDIIHSSPIFIGPPEMNWPNTAPFPEAPNAIPYSDFKATHANREGVVYVGANDGLLHGFRTSDGTEVLAYAPHALFSDAGNQGLHYLTDPAYAHRYYVDLTPTVSDVYSATTAAGSAAWHTVLIGGLRSGGRGLFALDVTEPTFGEALTDAQNTVMWEFTHADDPDLGFTFSRPAIVLLDNGQWAAIFGNGYNDTGSGKAQLFIVFLEGGLDGTWTLGSDYLKLSTEAGDATNRNGLATPAVIDTDGNGTADRAYAGDLQGHLWAFDLAGSTVSKWGIAFSSGSAPAPLFTAPANQPITTEPSMVRPPDIHTTNSNFPNVLAIFGTGQYLVEADKATTFGQTFYGVWDAGSGDLTQSDLIQQMIGTGATAAGVSARTLTNNTVDYSGSDRGWYINLPDSGERVITNTLIRGDLVLFNTTIPDSSPCAYGGTGWLMLAKIQNGGRPDEPAFDLNGDRSIDTLDTINSEAVAGRQVTGQPADPRFLGNKRYTVTTETTDGGTIWQDDLIPVNGDRTGRLSWEELSQ